MWLLDEMKTSTLIMATWTGSLRTQSATVVTYDACQKYYNIVENFFFSHEVKISDLYILYSFHI